MLRLRVAGGDYGRTRALALGSVRVEGVEIEYVPMAPSASIFAMATEEAFDVAEYSLSQLMIETSRDVDRFVALPVFLGRSFRHRDVYVAAGSDVEEPWQLRGRRVAVQRYHVTASLWTRGLLSDAYGVTASDIVWCKADIVRRGQPPVRLQLELPEDVRIERVEDASIDELLRSGRVDAAILPDAPPSFADASSGVERLFRELEVVERAYFAASGVFPIIHLVVMRRSISERHPGLLEALYGGFEAARAQWRAYLEVYGMQEVWQPFTRDQFPRGTADDVDRFWPYGLAPNIAALSTAVRYAWEQHLLRRPLAVSELFAPWSQGEAAKVCEAAAHVTREGRQAAGGTRRVLIDD